MGGESKNLGASFKSQDLHDISHSEAPGTQTSTPLHHRESLQVEPSGPCCGADSHADSSPSQPKTKGRAFRPPGHAGLLFPAQLQLSPRKK